MVRFFVNILKEVKKQILFQWPVLLIFTMGANISRGHKCYLNSVPVSMSGKVSCIQEKISLSFSPPFHFWVLYVGIHREN